MPFEGQFADAHEASGRELDRLTPGEDSLDDIRRQEGELDDATDLAGVDPIAVRNLPRGAEFSCRQLIEPAMGLGEQGDQALIGRRDGIITLTKNGPNLLLDHEAKPLKMSISTIGESPRFRCESD